MHRYEAGERAVEGLRQRIDLCDTQCAALLQKPPHQRLQHLIQDCLASSDGIVKLQVRTPPPAFAVLTLNVAAQRARRLAEKKAAAQKAQAEKTEADKAQAEIAEAEKPTAEKAAEVENLKATGLEEALTAQTDFRASVCLT